MSIFNKKHEYVIVTDMGPNRDVQEFVKKLCGDECELDVHVHGYLLKGNNLVTITFKTDIPEAIVYSELIDMCREADYNLALRRTLIFVFQKKEEES